MTPEEFQSLPLLLRRYDVIAAGISRKDIPKLVASGQLEIWFAKPNGKAYFRKESVARLLKSASQSQLQPQPQVQNQGNGKAPLCP